MKNLLLLMIIIVLITSSLGSKPVMSHKKELSVEKDEKRDFDSVPDSILCVDPTISSANRFENMTVRLYKDDQFWELGGLPDKEAFLSGNAQNIYWQNMSPVKRNTTIASVSVGKKKEITYKFEKQKFWKWNQNGKLIAGGRGGEYCDQLPVDGFTTAFHNYDLNNPLLIAFKDDKIYYYSTKKEELEPFGEKKGYIGGQFGENFPPDIDAAFTWPDSKGGFNIYMFREDKYCLRGFSAPKSGNYCDEWRENKQLFGCLRGMSKSMEPIVLTETDSPKSSRDVGLGVDNSSKPIPKSNGLSARFNPLILLFAILLVLY